jgi:hypothetical protein
MKRDAGTPGEYLDALDEGKRALFEQIRAVIREVMPDFVEGLRYGMLDYPGLANLGAQKRYVALYVPPDVLKAHRQRFPGVDAGRSCLRFRSIERADPEALATLLAAVRSARHDEH